MVKHFDERAIARDVMAVDALIDKALQWLISALMKGARLQRADRCYRSWRFQNVSGLPQCRNSIRLLSRN